MLTLILDFGRKMLSSPWYNEVYDELAILFLEQAMKISNSTFTAAHLAVALAKQRRWEAAMDLVSQLLSVDSQKNQEICQKIREAHRVNHPTLLWHVTLPEFDKRTSELFQAEAKRQHVYHHPSPGARAALTLGAP